LQVRTEDRLEFESIAAALLFVGFPAVSFRRKPSVDALASCLARNHPSLKAVAPPGVWESLPETRDGHPVERKGNRLLRWAFCLGLFLVVIAHGRRTIRPLSSFDYIRVFFRKDSAI
jgi:hypothetical protein